MSKQQNGSSSSGNRGYRTLPSAFRRSDESRRSSKGSSRGVASGAASPVSSSSSSATTSSSVPKNDFFSGISDRSGLMNNLGSLISGKMDSFLGNFKSRTKNNSTCSSPPPRSSSATESLTVATSTTSAGAAAIRTSSSVSGAAAAGKRSQAGTSPTARGGGGGGFGFHSFSFGASSACVSELIEMTNMTSSVESPAAKGHSAAVDDSFAEGDVEQVGQGHVFKPVGTFNPTWCDLCRDLVWGLYDTGASRCVGCHLTCHVKCQSKIKLNCQANSQLVSLSGLMSKGQGTSLEPLLIPEDEDSSSSTSSADELDRDESTMANISTLRDEEYSNRTLSAQGGGAADVIISDGDSTDGDDDEGNKTLRDISGIEDLTIDEGIDDLLEEEAALLPPSTVTSVVDFTRAIECYNKHYPLGQETVAVAKEDGIADAIPLTNCRGYIRVSLSLRRPIHVAAGTRPPSIYNLTSATLDTSTRTLTSFYLPQDTIRALHLTSLTTVYDVIRSLLGKFRVVDNPHKFALYERTEPKGGGAPEDEPMHRMGLRKMSDEEKPLLLALSRCLEEDEASDCCYFCLQENDPGEICWESFTLPELRNFLLILDREEAWYKRRIHEKYDIVQQTMVALMEQKKPASQEDTPEPSSRV